MKDHLGLEVGQAVAFQWVPEKQAEACHEPLGICHFWHPDCGYAVLIRNDDLRIEDKRNVQANNR